MKARATIIWVVCLLFGGASALAQGQGQEREDVVWVRFAEGETFTLDGQLDEPAWAEAAVVNLEYGQNAGLPGSGWFVQNIASAITEPSNPPVGTARFLAQGDYLYIAVEVEDKSIGGSTGLWNRLQPRHRAYAQRRPRPHDALRRLPARRATARPAPEDVWLAASLMKVKG